jgi:predicted DNA-binding protein (MmcQ/YjbR family)
MTAARARDFLLSLPHVVEAEQWGGLLYWVGDKAIGGRTCAMVNLEPGQGYPASFPAGPTRFAELLEREGIVGAPYSAQHFWVAIERWNALRDEEWQEELRDAHSLTFRKLPPGTRAILARPKAEQKRMVAARKRLLSERTAAK